MVEAQGGEASKLERITEVHRAPVIREFRANRSGQLTRMDAGTLGQAVLELGAGRAKASDPVDFAVGCDRIAKTGTEVVAGDVLLRVHARSVGAAESAIAAIAAGVEVE